MLSLYIYIIYIIYILVAKLVAFCGRHNCMTPKRILEWVFAPFFSQPTIRILEALTFALYEVIVKLAGGGLFSQSLNVFLQ